MSGGKYDYKQWHLLDIADEMERDVLNNNKPDEFGYCPNYSDEVLDMVKMTSEALKQLSEIVHAIDYLYSGDYGEDSFFEKMSEIDEKYNT